MESISSLENAGRIDIINTQAYIRAMDVRYELYGDTFIWDVRKAESNLRKHGVRFEEAATVFFDPLFVMVEASRNQERRQAAIGFSATGRLLYIVHLEIEHDCIRLISARRATVKEELLYAD